MKKEGIYTTTTNGGRCQRRRDHRPMDFFSSIPTEIRIDIYKACDILTLFLNGEDASRHLPTSARTPYNPIQIWVAALQSDYPGDIRDIPLVHRDLKYVSINLGKRTCLPDAAILCKFIKSKSMLERIYDSKLPVPDDVFIGRLPSPQNAVHVAMRHCWLDMVDIWDMTENDKENFAIRGSHWDYFRHLVTLRPDLKRRSNFFFDVAAGNGELELLQRLPDSITGTKSAMDSAAMKGHLDVVKWLHVYRMEGCSENAMNLAAANGYLHVVRWLHDNRIQGCTAAAMTLAAQNGHLNVVEFLHKNRTEGDVGSAIDWARFHGHTDIVEYLTRTSIL